MRICLGSLFFFFLQFASASIVVTDDAGHQIVLAKPATRIISLAPNITEILYAINAGADVVAVSSFSNYPKAATKLPIIASASHIDIESVLALHPDLVVSWLGGNSSEQISELKKLGIPVYQARFVKINDITHAMTNLAQLTGQQKQANLAIEQINSGFTALANKYANQRKITLFFELWPNPLMTINQESMINSVINLCDASNIFAKAKTTAPIVSMEAVITKNPMMIVTTMTNKDWQTNWQAWPQLTVTKNQFFFQISPDLLERPGPRLLNGAQALCQSVQQVRQQLAS